MAIDRGEAGRAVEGPRGIQRALDALREGTATAADLENLDARVTQAEADIAALEADPENITNATYATGWSSFGSNYRAAGYFKDRDMVRLCGGVKNGGTGTGLIFTLPVGYRPPATVATAVFIFGGNGSVQIGTDGTVTDLTFSASSKILTVLDNIWFRL